MKQECHDAAAGVGDFEGVELELDGDDEAPQFAPLSVEDEDEEDLMANFGIEVESDGGGEYPANQHGLDNGFNENDFKLYQKQRFGKAQHLDLEDEASQDFASEREDQILSLLDPE